jgi:SNF2 family DNA or RNA helicase
MEFLGGCDRKMLIFVHHIDVGDILMSRLGKLCAELEIAKPLQFQAGDDSLEFVGRFQDARIGIVSTLAGGEGMDGLQHLCSDMIMLERQWNPANEEQAEKRISQRIGQENHCTATYFVAVGTVCEFFSEIVERKREIVGKTLSGEAIEWNQSSLMKELTERLQAEGMKRWSLKK